MQEELLTFEQEFRQAVATNDVAAIPWFVADDWVIDWYLPELRHST